MLSTAVEAAIKIAIQSWRNRGERRTLIAALYNAYHGDTFGAMAASAPSLFTAAFGEHLFEVARLPDAADPDRRLVRPRAHRIEEELDRRHGGTVAKPGGRDPSRVLQWADQRREVVQLDRFML